jgi:hypothetical protein
VSGTTGSVNTTTGAITNIAINSGKITTCTFNDAPIQPKLTLAKTVVNDNGGTSVAKDFTLSATGSSGSFSLPAGSSTTSLTGNTGKQTVVGGVEYTLDETGPSGYSAGSWDCTGTGGTQNGDKITIAYGGDVTCSITNDDVAPQLTVIKHVINNNGGSASASDFTMSVTATNPSDDSFAGAESPGTTITLDAGSYSVSESGPSGYSESDSSDCSGTIAVGETKTCTITNDDQKASPGIGTTMKWTLNDRVTLSGFRTGGTGGTATFYLYQDDASCTAGTEIFSETVNVDNTTGTAHTTSGYTTEDVGTYYWVVVYSGNNYNNGTSTTCGSEVTTLP